MIIGGHKLNGQNYNRKLKVMSVRSKLVNGRRFRGSLIKGINSVYKVPSKVSSEVINSAEDSVICKGGIKWII